MHSQPCVITAEESAAIKESDKPTTFWDQFKTKAVKFFEPVPTKPVIRCKTCQTTLRDDEIHADTSVCILAAVLGIKQELQDIGYELRRSNQPKPYVHVGPG